MNDRRLADAADPDAFATDGDGPSGPPLTHQELLAHAGAFVRAGWRVNLAASDRAARRLVLLPRRHEAADPDGQAACEARQGSAGLAGHAFTETLWLEDWGDGELRLTRRLQVPGLAPAHLTVHGDSAPEMIERLQAVPHAVQFEWAGRLAWSLSLRLAAPGAEPVVRGAQARLPGLKIHASVSSVRGYDAELRLERADAGTPAAIARLPDDLLEVLGRAYGRLVPTATGWRGSVALGGGEPDRSRQARERLARVLAHLQATLAEAPAAWHARHRAARWGVSLRRSLPLALGLLVVGLGLWGAQRTERAEAWLGALANGAPPLLLVLLFMRREMLRLELPRWPRPPAHEAWQPRAADTASAAVPTPRPTPGP